MFYYVPEYCLTSFSGIVKSVTAVILRLDLSVRSFEDLGYIKIENAFLLSCFQQKSIVFIYPCVLDSLL